MSETLTILVTGGTGLVGRNLLSSRLAEDHDVHAPAHHELDLLDTDAVRSAVHRLSPDLVIHAAGRVGGIQANIDAPRAFLTTNTRMGLNLVSALAETGRGDLINLGSSCMYPVSDQQPLHEGRLFQAPLEPTNQAYALAKLTVARATRWLDDHHPDITARTLVPCNLYGPHDHYAPDRSHLIAAAIVKCDHARRTKASEVTIWGDGTARREFMFAPDLVDAIRTVIPRLPEIAPETNVGTTVDHTVNELYDAVAETVGYAGRFTHDLGRPVGMQRKLLDGSRLAELGWHAPTSLAEGLRQTYAHYLEHAEPPHRTTAP